MLGKKFVKNIALALGIFVGVNMTTTVSAKPLFSGEYRKGEILAFGSSLNNKEEAMLREYFGVSKTMKAIYVDNATAIKQLGLAPNALDDYTGGWYSSAYVTLTDKGGVKVSSNNVSKVTNEIFANALITSGITNCEVVVSAPFVVTGESALAGILAGAEEIMGDKLSQENKEVAKEEIDTTLEIADEILTDKSNDINSAQDSSIVASGIINDIKSQVIKDSPNSIQIQDIIINVTNNYGVELSKEANAKVMSLMEDVNDLDIEYKDIKESLNNIGSNIKDGLNNIGVQLRDSGILERISNWFKRVVKNIFEAIKNIFNSSDVEEGTSIDDSVVEVNSTDDNKEEVNVDESVVDEVEENTTEENVEEEPVSENDVVNNDEVSEEVVEEESPVLDNEAEEIEKAESDDTVTEVNEENSVEQ